MKTAVGIALEEAQKKFIEKNKYIMELAMNHLAVYGEVHLKMTPNHEIKIVNHVTEDTAHAN
jgi:hypothetical protein